jgi:hypothetical protein
VNDERALYEAVRDGDLATVQALIKDNPDLVFHQDGSGKTPLHWAATHGQKDVAEWLVANKAEVNASDKDGWTPLHWAAVRGLRDVVELLIANKADANAKTKNVRTALSLASAMEQRESAEVLRQSGGLEENVARVSSSPRSTLNVNARTNARAALWSDTGLRAEKLAELAAGSSLQVLWAKKEGGKEWARVTLADGRQGFVQGDLIFRLSKAGISMGIRADREAAWGYMGKGLGVILAAGIAEGLMMLVTDRRVALAGSPFAVCAVLYGVFQFLKGILAYLATFRNE